MLRRLLYVVGSATIALICSCGHEAEDPPVVWQLRDGTIVRFYTKDHDPPGRDKIKIMEVTRPKQSPKVYPFATWHAGYAEVELRTDPGQDVIWIVDARYRVVGCSLDLISGTFTDENEDHPKAVGATLGLVVQEIPSTPPKKP